MSARDISWIVSRVIQSTVGMGSTAFGGERYVRRPVTYQRRNTGTLKIIAVYCRQWCLGTILGYIHGFTADA